MIIACPQCGFSKDVSETALPKPVVIATCPKCAARFRFSLEHGVLGLVQDGPAANKTADDPLPAGAIVCGEDKGVSEEGQEEERTTESREEREHSATRRSSPLRFLPQGAGAGNPWDHAPGRLGWFTSFYQTCLRVMFQAPRFFRSLSPHRPFQRALAFYLIVCLFELLVNYGWLTAFRQTLVEASDPELTALFALLVPDGNIILMLLLQAAFSTLKLYLTSALFYLIFQLLAPGSNNYALIFQVVAYSIAPVVLALVPLAGSLCGALWSVACLAIGLRQVLGISWARTLVAFLPVICLLYASMRYLTSV